MGLTQLQLNNLSVAKNVGKDFALLAGLSSDRIPTSLLLLIGSFEGLLVYGAQWLVVSKRATLSYWQMCIFLCMGGKSTTLINTAILVTCIRNFRKNYGPVSGILNGYVRLSTAIFTDLSSSHFSSSSHCPLLITLGKQKSNTPPVPPSSLLLSLVPFAVCLFAILFLRDVPVPFSSTDADDSEKQEHCYFGVFNGVALAVALYLLDYDLTAPHNALFSRVFAVVLLVLLASPLAVPSHAFAKELFGLKYYELIYNILMLNLPLGSFLFSGLLAGLLYDREATETAEGGKTCSGAHCYRLVFVVMAFACIIGFGLDVLLAFRTKSVYSKISTSKKPNNLGRISS